MEKYNLSHDHFIWWYVIMNLVKIVKWTLYIIAEPSIWRPTNGPETSLIHFSENFSTAEKQNNPHFTKVSALNRKISQIHLPHAQTQLIIRRNHTHIQFNDDYDNNENQIAQKFTQNSVNVQCAYIFPIGVCLRI